MRKLVGHKVNGVNDGLDIIVADEPGPGGAHHRYEIRGEKGSLLDEVFFQKGAIAENGINGTTHEVLLEIIIDRLRCFQRGPYACTENAYALERVQEAQFWLKERTKSRVERGVEGTSVK